jgi:hypothetical protein
LLDFIFGNQIAYPDGSEEKMKVLEIIELRSSNKDHESLGEKLNSLINHLNKEIKNYKVKLYRHLLVETDWSFHVQFQTEADTTSPSPLGLRIASVLQEFGLVHHSMWSEEKGGNDEN